MAAVNARRCALRPMYGKDLLRAVHADLPVHHVNIIREKVGQPSVLRGVRAGCRNVLHACVQCFMRHARTPQIVMQELNKLQ